MGVLRAIAACALSLCMLGIESDTMESSLRATAKLYLAAIPGIAPVTGTDTAMDYYARLLDDADAYGQPPPDGYDATYWSQMLDETSRLNRSLARQLIARSYVPMGTIRGYDETLVRSSVDGTMQPVAVYVPPSYAPDRPAPLVVFLHGHQQSETSLFAPAFLHALADSTGTIVVAPYGRGYYDFNRSEPDVYDALDAATSAFNIDRHRRYLAGYSMGGFSVYSIAPMRPTAWAGIMSIAGALLDSRAQRVTSKLSAVRFYIVTGARDRNVLTELPTQSARFLLSSRMMVGFYSDPNGDHRLSTLRTVLAQAWDDMQRGIIREPPPWFASGQLSAPSTSVQP